MKFTCDDCGAQYKIADEKVGPRGVKVRCKRCSSVIVVRPSGELPEDADDGDPGPDEAFAGEAIEEEIGAAFDNIFGGEPHEGGQAGLPAEASEIPAATQASAGEDPFGHDVDDAFANALRSELEEETGSPGDVPEGFVVGPPPEAAEEEADDGEVWYVAVGDEQVGPLDLAGVRARWDAGDLTPDTLVWRAGMPDWLPLSSVDTLRRQLAPGPMTSEPSAPEPLGEVPTAAPASAPSDQETPAWKPAGASVLASLAAEEMAALDREPEGRLAAPSADPVGGLDPLASPAPSQGGGLDLDLPPPGAPPVQDPEPAPASYPAAPRPAPASARGGSESWMTPGRMVAMVGGSALAVAALVVGALWAGGVFEKYAAPVAAAVAPATPDAGTAPDPADGGALAAAAEGAVDGGADAGTEEASDGGLAEADGGEPADAGTQVAAAEPKAPEKPAAVAKAPAPAPKKTTTRRRTTRRRTTTTTRSEPTRTVAKAPEPKPTRKAVSDDDLFGDSTDLEEELFGSRSTSRSPSTGSTGSSGGSRPAGYIPPEAGSRDLPKALSSGTLLMTVGQHKSELVACVERQRKADPSLKGRLIMSWKVLPTGRTRDVRCTNLQSSEMCKCAKEVFGGLKFPPYGGPQMEPVTFPLDF